VQSLEDKQATLQKLYDSICDESIVLPDYYTVPFHAYDDGNMNWLAAYEVEPATFSMAMRVWKDERNLTPQEAQSRLRNNGYDEIKTYLGDSIEVRDVLDIGCSTGLSTRFLARAFPQASRVLGLDLSPFFLSVAMLRQEEATKALFEEDLQSLANISYVHKNAEDTGFPEESFDVIAIQFVAHELPPEPTNRIAQECIRLLRPGGVVAIIDNDPQSEVIQSLPPPIFTLMKSTEPHSDQYYAFDQEENLRSVGFVDIVTSQVDPRHRLILGRK